MNSAALAAAACAQLAIARARDPSRGQLVGSLPQPGNLADPLEHGGRRHRITDLDALAVLEVIDDRPKLAEIKMSREDILDRFIDDPTDQLVFVPFFLGHGQLELAP